MTRPGAGEETALVRYGLHFPLESLPIHEQREIDRYFEAGVDSVIIGLLEGAVDPREAARSIAPILGS